MEKFAIILLAGGDGKRFGWQKKQYLELAPGIDLIQHAVSNYSQFGMPIILSTQFPEEDLEDYAISVAVQAYRDKGVSILAALDEARDVENVILAEAVRPFTPQGQVWEIIKKLNQFVAVVCGIPMYETVYTYNDKVVEVTDRNMQYMGQTPEGWNTDWLRMAVLDSLRDGDRLSFSYAKALERQGEPIGFVEGSPLNFKITFPHDMDLARALYERGEGLWSSEK